MFSFGSVFELLIC